MMGKEIEREIKILFSDAVIDSTEKNRLKIRIKKDLAIYLLEFLKSRGFNYLVAISCVDWIKEGEFELVYQIGKIDDPLRIMVKTRISRDRAEFKSAINVYKNAQTYEREIHELFGIRFEGNPRLIPLFLENWNDIPPFRKDFDTRKYVKETFEGIPTLEESK